MNEETYKIYDSINNFALKVLLWNEDTKGKLGFFNLDTESPEDLWLLSILKQIYSIRANKYYYKGSWLDYLYFKYIKGFKFLKYSFNDKDKFFIDAIAFEVEVVYNFCEHIEVLADIYETYYRR